MANYDDLKLSVEMLSGGRNTVVLDDMGMPSIMVKIPKFKISDVIDGATETTHPAFVVNGVEKDFILISKYQNIVMNDRAYSMPGQDPKTYVNFDQAKAFCENKGKGWHLMTNAEWAAIALWCKKNGFMPRGNNNYGADVGAKHEKGIVTYKYTSNNIEYVGRVATGSGPSSWAHDMTSDGIFDMNGNVWEWSGGLRLKEGEIQIIPDNNAADAISQVDASTLWKAIKPDGSLCEPGTADSLKWNYTTLPTAGGNGAFELISGALTGKQADDAAGYGSKSFETLTAKAGLTPPQILKALGLFPVDASHGGDTFFFRNNGERLPLRGGSWNGGAGAGVFALDLDYPRSSSGDLIGFRSAFVNL